ncbi:MAG: uracil-DNA glycosylase [Comamonadaceae bacterium]|nr:MAG: uracil-DNA glycosylase [Comamonadaceae bacterium]
MTLELDARRRAMLEEMGVKAWWPGARSAAGAAPVASAAGQIAADPMPPVEASSRPAAASGPSGPSGAPLASATPEAAARLSLPAAVPPESSVSPRSPAARVPPPSPPRTPAPVPTLARTDVVFDAAVRLYLPDGVIAPAAGGWLVVVDLPPTDEGAAAPLAGDAGRLLDNMLRALQLHRGERPVHLVRARRADLADASGGTGMDAFERELGMLKPCVVLAMGPLAAQTLLHSTEPLGRLRGRAVPLGEVGGPSAIATYPPAYLLRNPADKARAWADLCLAAEVAEAAGGAG